MVNFYLDLASILRVELLAKGYIVPATATNDGVVEGYLNILNRQIPVRPRIFHESSEVNCPSDLAPGYQELKRKVEAGESLKPHQSTSINTPDYYDALYLDWRIQHFHLKTRPHPRQVGFVERSGPLLFAQVTGTDFYAIQVYQHGAWSKQELIEIFERNWPQQLDRFRLKGLRPLGPIYTNEDIAAFRKAGITALTVAGGNLIAPIGGGFRSNGQSSLILENRGNLVSICKEFEQKVLPNSQNLLRMVASRLRNNKSRWSVAGRNWSQ